MDEVDDRGKEHAPNRQGHGADANAERRDQDEARHRRPSDASESVPGVQLGDTPATGGRVAGVAMCGHRKDDAPKKAQRSEEQHGCQDHDG